MNDRIKNEIDRELSTVVFVNDERLERLTARKDSKMKISKKFIAFGVAAAVVAGSAVTVGAVNEWNYKKVVERLFPRAVTEPVDESRYENKNEVILAEATKSTEPVPELVEEAAKLLDGVMYEIPAGNVKSTFTNYDVSADGFIFDGTKLKICFTFRDKNGYPFSNIKSGEYYFSDVEACTESGERLGDKNQGWKVQKDGSLTTDVEFAMNDNKAITEPTKATVTLRYLLANALMINTEGLEGVAPENILDEGTLTAEITLMPNEKINEYTLTDKDGKSVTAEITATRVRICYTPDDKDPIGLYIGMISDTMFIYDKDGNEIIRPFCFGDGEDNTYAGYAELNFAMPVDIDSIASMRCGTYKYGDVPPLDLSSFDSDYVDYIRERYGVED